MTSPKLGPPRRHSRPSCPADRGPPPPPPPGWNELHKPAATDVDAALSRALDHDDNLLARIDFHRQKEILWDFLYTRIAEIEAIVCFHLRLKTCKVSETNKWICGSYNVCIPVYIKAPSDARVLVRIPLAYKVGEENHPGNVDEKLRCEVASYIWMQENASDIPIPKLYGCGFTDGQTFTCPDTAPIVHRLIWYTKRTVLSWLRFPTPCRYVSRQRPDSLNTGYIIISYIADGKMLSQSWESFRHDKGRRDNLLHDLAKVMLSLSKTPLPRIGSFTLDRDGVLTLTNRPLTLRLQTLENEGISTGIGRNSTYSSTEIYLQDLLTCHDNRIHYQPNSIHDEDDGRQQLAALTIMRAVMHHFTHRSHRHGPFFFGLTDLHQSNIFVDEEWHITSLIDLEWACSLPVEFRYPPYWLSGRSVDGIENGEQLEIFSQLVKEFFDILEQEEKNNNNDALYHTPIFKKNWDIGAFWYFHALNSPKGLYQIFNEHIQRRFCPEHCKMVLFDEIVTPYWCVDSEKVIEKKIEEEAQYKDRLREILANDISLVDAII